MQEPALTSPDRASSGPAPPPGESSWLLHSPGASLPDCKPLGPGAELLYDPTEFLPQHPHEWLRFCFPQAWEVCFLSSLLLVSGVMGPRGRTTSQNSISGQLGAQGEFGAGVLCPSLRPQVDELRLAIHRWATLNGQWMLQALCSVSPTRAASGPLTFFLRNQRC